jgi:hypothetical protein
MITTTFPLPAGLYGAPWSLKDIVGEAKTNAKTTVNPKILTKLDFFMIKPPFDNKYALYFLK